MSTESPHTLTSSELTISTTDKDSTSLKSKLQAQLRYYYSRRLFVQEVDHNPDDGHLSVTIGIAYPQDVSGTRNGGNVLKMVNIGEVDTITAIETGNGYYKFDLPSRSDLYSDFKERHDQLLTDLDWSMAKAIYGRVYKLNPVRNQLNSVIQIVNWVRRKEDLTIEEIESGQTTDNSRDYIRVLSNLGFLRVEDGYVRPGRKIESADLQNLSRDEYERRVVGDLVDEGYYALREELDLRMLNHFPKFANSYYISAFRRESKDLWLSVDDVVENLRMEYGSDESRLAVEDKLRSLARDDVGVLKYEGDEVGGNPDIYDQVQGDHPLIG